MTRIQRQNPQAITEWGIIKSLLFPPCDCARRATCEHRLSSEAITILTRVHAYTQNWDAGYIENPGFSTFNFDPERVKTDVELDPKYITAMLAPC